MPIVTNMSFLAVSDYLGDGLIFMICALPAWILAANHSRWLVTYCLATWAFGPEVRRINDWLGGGYQSITLVSLIPMAATGALLISVFERPIQMSRQLRRAILMIVIAIAYGAIIGVLFNGFSAAFEGLGLLVPFLFVPYAISRPYISEDRDLWLQSLSTISAVVAAYGWYQFLEAPQWDMTWLIQSGMYSSMGIAKAESFRVFSTLNAAGPMALFLAAALIIGLCNRRWRGPLGLIGSLLIGSCLLISQVRTAWIMFAIAMVVYICIQRGANRWTTLGTTLGALLLVFAAAASLPGADLLSTRFDTFNNLNEDTSAQGRIGITISGIGSIFSYPLGRGLGATGVGAKLVTKDDVNGGTDNGYIDLAITLGPAGAVLLLVGITKLGLEARRIKSGSGFRSRLGWEVHSALSTAMLVAYGAGLFIFNNLGGVGGALFWLVLACPLCLQTRFVPEDPGSEDIEGDSALLADDMGFCAPPPLRSADANYRAAYEAILQEEFE